MDINISMYKLPITNTNSEPSKYQIVLKADGLHYEIENLFKRLQHLYNKEELLKLKYWIKK
ncbi:MAG: hypothetical protein GY714_20190 [Desulfobacterales bacterium]|nr:hypothetical protein [Desulfobacterales bacterium]